MLVASLAVFTVVCWRAVSIDFPTDRAPAIPPALRATTTKSDPQRVVASANELLDR